MNAKEIIEKADQLEIVAKRRIEDKYAEIVFLSRDISQWEEFLERIFGPALNPMGIRPTQEDLKLTENYGGIYDEQVLYKQDFNQSRVLAMLWPWQDGEKITLKIVVLNK